MYICVVIRPSCLDDFWFLFRLAKDGKKVREKIRELASKVEAEDFSQDLEMVCL